MVLTGTELRKYKYKTKKRKRNQGMCQLHTHSPSHITHRKLTNITNTISSSFLPKHKARFSLSFSQAPSSLSLSQSRQSIKLSPLSIISEDDSLGTKISCCSIHLEKNAISKPIHFLFFINLPILSLFLSHSHFNSFLSTSLLYSFVFLILDGWTLNLKKVLHGEEYKTNGKLNLKFFFFLFLVQE